MITINKIREIAKMISRTFNSTKCNLTDWITTNIKTIELNSEIKLSSDDIFDQFSDEETKSFKKLVNVLEKNITNQKSINRIEILHEIDGIKIELNAFGKRTKTDISKELNEWFIIISSWSKMQKGSFYEHFCSLFLEDLGLSSKVTKLSGDKGIDIIAKYKTKLDEELGHLVFNDYVYLLAQAKFFNNKVDTPVLRKLLGDSILLRFDQIDYLDIAHNAFHLLVFSHNGYTSTAIDFAEKNKMMIFETEQLISIIASGKKSKKWKSYMYIKKEVDDKPA